MTAAALSGDALAGLRVVELRALARAAGLPQLGRSGRRAELLEALQPAGADLRSAVDVLRLVGQARRIRGGAPAAAVFLNRATKGTRLLAEAREVIAALDGFRPLGQAITQRQALSDCFAQGQTVFEASTGPPLEAAAEYGRLFAELLNC